MTTSFWFIQAVPLLAHPEHRCSKDFAHSVSFISLHTEEKVRAFFLAIAQFVDLLFVSPETEGWSKLICSLSVHYEYQSAQT
jgi:hypothetical protein